MFQHASRSAARRALAAAPALFLLAGAALAGDAPKQPAAPEPPALPLPLAGYQDEGVFQLYVKESRLATLAFKWQPDGAV